VDQYTLVLGLPHTNHLGLAEHLLLQQAGHFQWTSIARALGSPLSSLRTRDGREVYATFYYIEERFPDDALLDTFQLDDRLTFAVFLRTFKGIAVEGTILFDRDSRLKELLDAEPSRPSEVDANGHPYIRFANIFITPEAGNSRLKVATPASVDLSGMVKLPDAENPYHLTKRAEETGELGILGEGWRPIDLVQGFEVSHDIDIDRDTNGAGLVYFANYVTFMDRADREAMRANSQRRFTEAEITSRVVQERRVAYYGNVATNDRVRTRVHLFAHDDRPTSVGIRYEMRRGEDAQLICLSEAVKVLC
jgi:probable biosynthetic protein (TIGR04098 family)